MYLGEGSWFVWVSSRLAASLPNSLSGVLPQIDLCGHVGARDLEFPSVRDGIGAARAQGQPFRRGHAEHQGQAAGKGLSACPSCAIFATLEAQRATNRAPNMFWGNHLVGIALLHTCHHKGMSAGAYH